MSTWNPSDVAGSGTTATFSQGNLMVTLGGSGSYNAGCRGTLSHLTGKWYFEAQQAFSSNDASLAIGFANSSANLTSQLGYDTNSMGCQPYFGDAVSYNGNAVTQSGNGAGTTGDWYGIALDLTNELAWITSDHMVRSSLAWNSAALASSNPATGIGGTSFSSSTGPWFPACCAYFGGSWLVNLGGLSFHFGCPGGGFNPWDSDMTPLLWRIPPVQLFG